MTYREKFHMEHPDRDSVNTLRMGCPADYAHNTNCPEYSDGTVMSCKNCWNREIPEEKEKENKPMKKTKAMLEEELDQKRAEIEELKKELTKVDKYKQYDDMAGEVKAIYDSLVNAGFNEDQAFVLLNTMINNQKSAAPVYSSSRYPTATAAFRK